MNGSFKVSSVEETWALAAKLAGELRPGDVVCLEGGLGSGKTTFTQGLAAALGVKGRVASPTFCLAVEHRGEGILMVHMDLYRLHGEDDVLAMGWEDYVAANAIIVVEWPERAGTLIPGDAQRVSISGEGDGELREIVFARNKDQQEEEK